VTRRAIEREHAAQPNRRPRARVVDEPGEEVVARDALGKAPLAGLRARARLAAQGNVADQIAQGPHGQGLSETALRVAAILERAGSTDRGEPAGARRRLQRKRVRMAGVLGTRAPIQRKLAEQDQVALDLHVGHERSPGVVARIDGPGAQLEARSGEDAASDLPARELRELELGRASIERAERIDPVSTAACHRKRQGETGSEPALPPSP
jgi:hypothetical protein